jgi:hypothetical protein
MPSKARISAESSVKGKPNPSFSQQGAAPFRSIRSPAERWFSLQETVGNQTVQTLQTRFKIGPPNDRCEQKADRAADTVVRRPDGASVQGSTATHPVDVVQREPLRREGQAIPDSVRSYFEPRLGHNLGEVRLHTDSRAAQLTQSLQARAFTVGRDIFFGAGEYAPQTVEGKRLIAHELTHVLQQRSGPAVIQRKIKFDSPTYSRMNPIERILGNQPVGYTTPTVNGNAFPNDFMQAGELVFQALQPKGAGYDSKTKECSFNDFDVTVSANVIIPTEPEEGGWSMTLPGSAITGTSACRHKKSVPVTMIGKPSHEAAGKWIEKNEEEHVDDLKRLYGKYLKAHFDWLLALKVKRGEREKCADVLMKALGDKDAVAVRDFLKELIEAVTKRDEGGKHSLSNKINIKENCSSIEIESTKK